MARIALTRASGLLGALGVVLMLVPPAQAFRVIDLRFANLGFPRWDADPRTVSGQERSLDAGLRYSVEGGSYQAYRDLFTWFGPAPTVAEFQQAIEDAFNAWTVTDPATQLEGAVSFVSDLGTPVVAVDPSGVSGLNAGAEIDLLAVFQPQGFAGGFAFFYVDDTANGPLLTLTSGTTDYIGPAISGADILMNNDSFQQWDLDSFQLVLTHEIGHALGLADVEVFPGPSGLNSLYFDDDYDDTSSATALATLTNSFSLLIDPFDPDSSALIEFVGTLNSDPGLDTFGVDILMETAIPLLDIGAPLQNDDFAGRQFLYPLPLPEPGQELLLAAGIAGLALLGRGRSRP